jgi:hypothetical protein
LGTFYPESILDKAPDYPSTELWVWSTTFVSFTGNIWSWQLAAAVTSDEKAEDGETAQSQMANAMNVERFAPIAILRRN